MATGRKTVVVGQTLDPVVWGNPLWDQSVQTFASNADRTAQFGAPKQGAVTWLEDVKQLQVYDGTAWVPVATAKPVVVACPLDALWVPAPGGYQPPRLSRVAGRWTLTAVWSNAGAGSFTAGWAPLLTLPAAARVAIPAFQVPSKTWGFPTGTSFVDVDPTTGLVRWWMPSTVAVVDDESGEGTPQAAANALSGAFQATWDAVP